MKTSAQKRAGKTDCFTCSFQLKISGLSETKQAFNDVDD
jgi:hypothetical protein